MLCIIIHVLHCITITKSDYYCHTKILTYSQDEALISLLVHCISEGKSLVIINVNVDHLNKNDLLNEVLTCKITLMRGKSPLKIKVSLL